MVPYCQSRLKETCGYIEFYFTLSLEKQGPWAYIKTASINPFYGLHIKPPSDPGQETLKDRRCISYHCEAKVGSWGLRLATTQADGSVPGWLYIPMPGSQGVLGKDFLSLGTL